MLVLSPDSTCDVCMENYMEGAGIPYAINCGHVFCRACLAQMQPRLCPFCRNDFAPGDICKLHVCGASSTTVASQIDAQTRRILNDIANAGGGSATLEEMQRVIDRCDVFHNVQQQSPHTPLGVSYFLLFNLLEARKKLRLQADQLSQLRENQDQLTLDLVAALQKEETIQALNDVWRREVESTARKNQSLREELNRLRSTMEMIGKANANSASDRSTIRRRTVVAGSTEANRNNIKPITSRPRRSIPLKVVLVSVGIIFILRTFSVASKMGRRK